MISKKVARQDARIVHNRDIPYVAPALAIDVTLPVPMLNPNKKIPGRNNARNFEKRPGDKLDFFILFLQFATGSILIYR